MSIHSFQPEAKKRRKARLATLATAKFSANVNRRNCHATILGTLRRFNLTLSREIEGARADPVKGFLAECSSVTQGDTQGHVLSSALITTKESNAPWGLCGSWTRLPFFFIGAAAVTN